MSLFSSIGKFISRAIPKEIKSVASVAAPFLPGAGGIIAGAVSALPTITQNLPQISRAIPRISLPGAGALRLPGVGGVVGTIAGGAAAQYIIDQFGRRVRINPKTGLPYKRRRMNPLNARAARRAARRLCAVQNICKDIERALPRPRSSGRRCAPRRKKCR